MKADRSSFATDLPSKGYHNSVPVYSCDLLQNRIERISKHRFQQAAAVGFGGGDMGFQLVAQRHQLIDLGNDAVLFGEGCLSMCALIADPAEE
jgi:hypothetical protein